jgi:thiol-disulfide isomerase/thioredoxin
MVRPEHGRVLPALLMTLWLAGPSPCGDDHDGWEPAKRRIKDFSVKDLEGRVLKSRELAGRVVVVDFWTTWCAPCIKELPELAGYHERLRQSDKLAMLSFNATEPREDVLDFARRERIAFPIYLADDLLDRFEVSGFPTKLILDFRGATPTERYRRVGYTPLASIEARVREVLDRPVSTD